MSQDVDDTSPTAGSRAHREGTLTVLKLGGSVITHKDSPETVDRDALQRAAGAVATFLGGEGARGDGSHRLVVVHGGGSFGHHHAARHHVSTTDGTRDATAVTDIHRAMETLDEAVVDELQAASVGAVPVRPLSVAVRSEDCLRFPTGQVAAMLSEGFVPVTHGDVVVEEGAGATILSGDELVVTLAGSLDADRVGLCSTVSGVLDEAGNRVSEIRAYDDVADTLTGSEATDVTGGMAGKVQQLLTLDAPASIFDLDALESFLATGTAGTVVYGTGD